MPAVAGVEDDPRARVERGSTDGRRGRGGRRALGQRGEREREPAPVTLHPVGRRRLEVEHDADLAALSHTDPRPPDRRRRPHGAERPATEAGPAREIDVHARRRPVRSGNVADRGPDRGREQQDRGRTPGGRRHLQAPQLGRVTVRRGQGEARTERRGPPPPPLPHGK